MYRARAPDRRTSRLDAEGDNDLPLSAARCSASAPNVAYGLVGHRKISSKTCCLLWKISKYMYVDVVLQDNGSKQPVRSSFSLSDSRKSG